MKRNGTPGELLSWFRINMENTNNIIIDLNTSLHTLRMSGKDDLDIAHVLRMSEIYLKKYLQDQEEECKELLKDITQVRKGPAKIYQLKKR